MARHCRIQVPAKINLWLEVIGKRPDGYHDLSSLMLPIGVHDDIELELQPAGGNILECNDPDIPVDAGNLAWRAAQLYLDRVKEWKVGFSIRLSKHIPVGAGLGGGSADAAGVLIALNSLCPFPLGGVEIHILAHSLGADVPFCLYHRPALAKGIGEKLENVDGLPQYQLVLIKPPIAVSTAWAYSSLRLTRGESRINIGRLLAQPWDLQSVMQNDLEAVTMVRYPILAAIKSWLIEHGAVGALMSGSGPTVFGVFRHKNEAEEAGSLARGAWRDCWVAVTEIQKAPCPER